tara:strand:- start:4485 stop:4841 length:357 start_codon:yes stop_codon:yes gene_type:complete
MNCDDLSENACYKSYNCFLCVDNGKSKCISNNSNEKNKCDLANPYNYNDYEYTGTLKSIDSHTKDLSNKANMNNKPYNLISKVDDIFKSLAKGNDVKFDFFNTGILLIIIGYFLICFI